MLRSLSQTLILCVLATGCGGSGNGKPDTSPDDFDFRNEFRLISGYSLADFNLDGNFYYWELRMHAPFDNEEPYSTLYQYDKEAMQQLNQEQRSVLEGLVSEQGFRSNCSPEYCPVFGVSISDGDPDVYTNLQEVMGFFGTLDSEAELHVLLWANEYEAHTYEAVAGGYRATAHWYEDCGDRGTHVLFVDVNGVITKEKELRYQGSRSDFCI